MLLNIALLIFVFSAEKKKVKPYIAALLMGVLKAVITAVFSRNILGSIVVGVIYAGLAAAFVYFMKRLDRRDDVEREETPSYRSPGSEKMKFRWEYIPLVVLLLLIVGGELLLIR
jgi:Ca2+/Na+ antiporter